MDKINQTVSLELTAEQITTMLAQMRQHGQADKRFDLNLVEGHVAEHELASILETVELKKDYKAKDTGNVVIEYEYRGQPSGIATTKAKYWAFWLVGFDTIIIIKTTKLKALAKYYWYQEDHNVIGGDDNASKLILLPIQELLKGNTLNE